MLESLPSAPAALALAIWIDWAAAGDNNDAKATIRARVLGRMVVSASADDRPFPEKGRPRPIWDRVAKREALARGQPPALCSRARGESPRVSITSPRARGGAADWDASRANPAAPPLRNLCV